MTTINSNEAREVIEKLSSKGVDGCALCKSPGVKVYQNVVRLGMFAYVLVCQNCGHMMFVSVDRIGEIEDTKP